METDVLHLAGLLSYRDRPEDVSMLINALPELDMSDLFQFRQRLQTLRELQDIGR